MRIKQLAVIAAATLYAVAAWSGEEVKHEMKIKVIADDGEGATHLSLDSDDLGFNLSDLQVGENRSVVDKDGRPILITRTESGYSFDVDGKTIDMPAFDGEHEGNVWVMKGDHGIHGEHEMDVDVHVMNDDVLIEKSSMEGVMIISDKEIDPATQKIISDALAAAGHEGVRFAGGHDGGPHEVRVVKKVVEITE